MSNLIDLEFKAHNIATSPFYEYQSIPDTESKGKWMVKMSPLNGSKSDEPARGFATKKDAQDFVNNTHYPHTMQPYVAPMPTWIDASKQLPSHHQDVIVYRYNDNDGGNIEHSLYFDGEVMKGFGNVADEDGFFDDVYYWQPIETKSLYEAMQMQLQINEVAK